MSTESYQPDDAVWLVQYQMGSDPVWHPLQTTTMKRALEIIRDSRRLHESTSNRVISFRAQSIRDLEDIIVGEMVSIEGQPEPCQCGCAQQRLRDAIAAGG